MNSRDDLLCMFTTQVSEEDGSYTIEVPASEVEFGTVEPGEPLRVGVFANPETEEDSDSNRVDHASGIHARTPPVEEGETRTVTIEHIGDKGDGIAKVESGFVLIVPGTEVGDDVHVEIRRVNENFAIAEPLDGADSVEQPEE